MVRSINSIDRDHVTLFPDRLEDWIGEDHLVRVVDLFVEELDLLALGFELCVSGLSCGVSRPASRFCRGSSAPDMLRSMSLGTVPRAFLKAVLNASSFLPVIAHLAYTRFNHLKEIRYRPAILPQSRPARR